MRKVLFVAAFIAFAGQASAASWMIGDDDGYGIGIPDGANHTFVGPIKDYRSAAEMAATDGAQFTDTYSTTHPGYSPQAGTVATFTFAGLGNTWSAGHLVIDAADFQADTFGHVITTFNGIVQDFGYNDGYPKTVIHEYDLDAAVLASINLTGQLNISINRNGSGDFYGFDYLKLNDFPITSAVPEPETYAMMLAGLGLMGVVARRRKSKQQS